ncbi:arylesterase [Acidimangrovimonas pyrenivorans]|uniref:Arylesterase n=1 Tax=Acidimangrovimonas pyrenivorans TaxID=2030798 RepID=A0ABV7ALA7_9RHOB
MAAAPLPAAARTALIAFGDSLTEGYGLIQGEGFVPQLQAWLTAHGADVKVMNAGVSGDTTAGGLSRIGWTLSGAGDAIIVELGGNDLLRGIDPAHTRANLDGILKAASDKGLPILLIGMTAPANYGPDFQRRFDAIFPELARKYGALYVPNFFAALDALPDRTKAMNDYMQGDAIHPSAAGVKLIVDDLGPKVLELLARVN